MNEPRVLNPDLAKLIREEIRAGFFCDPPTANRDMPHDIELQRRVLASFAAGFEHAPLPNADDFYGSQHQMIFEFLSGTRAPTEVINGLAVRVLDEQLRAEYSNIEDCPVMVGKPLREAVTRLHILACLRRCSAHLQRALARIETVESVDLIRDSIKAALEEL